MIRLVVAILAIAVAVSLPGVFGLWALSGGAEARAGAPALPDDLDYDEPIVVVVRGWLWDPESRKGSRPLEWFPLQVNRRTESQHDLTVTFIQYSWSRLPSDLGETTREFVPFAAEIAERAGEAGRCVHFMGHSAGAAMVYRAAAEGVPMGYMGTLGLPTWGSAKPEGVAHWANFYTSTHLDDVAGRLWGQAMQADVNIDLEADHKQFWGRMPVVLATADGIAESWDSCH